ncbi:MAG: hypothetical protein AAF371_07020 [Pseudomonadota bacterium]
MPRDLSDLCENWLALRERLMVEERPPTLLDSEQRELVHWLVMLADRICIDYEDHI